MNEVSISDSIDDINNQNSTLDYSNAYSIPTPARRVIGQDLRNKVGRKNSKIYNNNVKRVEPSSIVAI